MKISGRRRASSVIVGGLLLFSAVACGSDDDNGGGGSDSDTPTIGYLQYANARVADREALESIKAEVEAQGGELVAFNADGDATKQPGQVEQMITQGVDGVVATFIDATTGCQMAEELQAEDIPVVHTFYGVDNCKLDYLVQRDDAANAKSMVEAAVAAHPKGNYVLISGDQGATNAQIYMETFKEELAPYVESGDIKIVSDKFTPMWDPAGAQAQTEAALTANNDDIQAVLAANDGMANGAVQALKAAGVNGSAFVSGQDADIPNVQNVLRGDQALSIWPYTKEQGRLSAAAVMALVNGDDLPEGTIDMPNGDITVPGIYQPAIPLTDEQSVADWFCEYHPYKADEIYVDDLADMAPDC